MKLEDVLQASDLHEGQEQQQQGADSGKTTFIWMLLATMKKSFYNIDVTNPLNPTAAELFVNNKEEFNRRAEACVEESINNVHNNPPNSSLKFSEADPAHDETLKNFLESKQQPSFLTSMIKGVQQGVTSLFNMPY
eukprot:TRINITY_DN1444_c0_g1_i3.p1 TRINITY_DN1444_c0_g1~~TRINITY_DN1444_c0_g1_i3.p1  ORF type:complete len:136 (+),score=56.24 TRINITY_DN1444_c0_g1_i3:479-886(+)